MNAERPVIEIYSSMECPYAYLATYRLRQLWPEYSNRLCIRWRALSLEYVNQQTYPKPLFDAEYALFQRIEPGLPWQPWAQQDWQWPSTFWPAFEALACAQAQNDQAAFEMSWALRHAYFARSRCLALRHEVFAVAEEVAEATAESGRLNLAQFKADWDSGRGKAQIVLESQRGWHEVKVEGSATLILPNQQRITNPAIGEIDFDEEHYQLRSYQPYQGDPLNAYRELLDQALS